MCECKKMTNIKYDDDADDMFKDYFSKSKKKYIKTKYKSIHHTWHLEGYHCSLYI